MRELVISKYEAGQRFDKFLAKYMELAPKSFFYKMMRKKNITLNGKKAAGNEKLEKGDTVKLFLSEETIEGFREKKKRAVHTGAKLDILYEDEQALRADRLHLYNVFGNFSRYIPVGSMLINKPAGMLSQKAEKGDISMVEHLISHLLDTGEVTEEMLKTFRPSLCNRLDRNTSGIVAAGKTLQGLQMLSGLFKERTLHKYYLCIVKGVIKEEQDVRGWLLKNEKTNQVRIFKNETKDARPIHTKYRPLADNGQETLLEIELLTGRTHQIRAHLSYMGHPIFGDPKYGDAVLNKKLTSGYGLHMQLLHAWHLVFPELSGDFEGLSGKSIYAPAPKQFVSIAQKRGLGTWEHGIPEV